MRLVVAAGLLLLAGCAASSTPLAALEGPVAFHRADGLVLRADLFRPAGEGPFPTLLWLHGGGLIFGSRGDLPDWQRQAYLDAGYLVVAPDYRLAPEASLDAIVADVEAAYAWLRREGQAFGVDPERIALVGHSAGAYLALTAAGRVEPAPRAVVSFYGYGEVSGGWATTPSPYYTQGPPLTAAEARRVLGDGPLADAPSTGGQDDRFQFYLYTRQQGAWASEVAGPGLWQDRASLRRYEPLHLIEAGFPPTVLLHGHADVDVPAAESAALARAMERAGVPHVYMQRPAWGHAFDAAGPGDPEVANAFDIVLGFLGRYLR